MRPAPGIIERLDAVAIADQSDVAALGIEDREGEHADEAIHAAFAPFHVGVQDHLGVGARAEAVPEPQKLLADRLEVVDLAVVGDPPASAGIAHGHVARRRQVDDAEALRAERVAAATHRAAVVGPAVRGQLAHGANQRLVQLPAAIGVEADHAGNAAHTERPFATSRGIMRAIVRPRTHEAPTRSDGHHRRAIATVADHLCLIAECA